MSTFNLFLACLWGHYDYIMALQSGVTNAHGSPPSQQVVFIRQSFSCKRTNLSKFAIFVEYAFVMYYFQLRIFQPFLIPYACQPLKLDLKSHLKHPWQHRVFSYLVGFTYLSRFVFSTVEITYLERVLIFYQPTSSTCTHNFNYLITEVSLRELLFKVHGSKLF